MRTNEFMYVDLCRPLLRCNVTIQGWSIEMKSHCGDISRIQYNCDVIIWWVHYIIDNIDYVTYITYDYM